MLFTNFLDFPNIGWRSQFDELDRMRNQINRMIGNLDRFAAPLSGRGVFPLLNLTEDKDNYYLRAELPGVTGDNLELNVTDDNISISGERKISEGEKEITFHRRERDAGSFARAITLPGKIDSEKIEANLRDGILELTIPKAEEAKPKQIKVK